MNQPSKDMQQINYQGCGKTHLKAPLHWDQTSLPTCFVILSTQFYSKVQNAKELMNVFHRQTL